MARKQVYVCDACDKELIRDAAHSVFVKTMTWNKAKHHWHSCRECLDKITSLFQASQRSEEEVE